MISNSTKVWIFTLLTNMILLVSGFILWERLGLFLCFMISVVLHYFIFRGYQSPLIEIFKPVQLVGLDPWNLQNLNLELNSKSSMAPTEICITDVPILNSFIIKMPWKKGRIVFSRELLKKLSEQELKDLLVYHSNCIEELNSFRNEFLLIIFSTLKSLATSVDQIFRIHFFAPIAEKIITAFQKIFFTNSYIMKSDQKVGTKNPHVIDYAMMIWKFAGWSSVKIVNIPDSQKIYFFMDPAVDTGSNLAKTHPLLSIRLKKLTGYFPI